MLKVGLFVKLQAKHGKEAAVIGFLESGLELANQETGTPVWFALQTRNVNFWYLRYLC